jgi:hypothetical protein
MSDPMITGPASQHGETDTDPLPLSDYAKLKTFNDASQLMAFLGAEQFRPGRWIFRGQPNADWSLQPSLERFAASLRERPYAVEQYIDAEFRRHAHHYLSDTPGSDDLLDWFALMRHHGAPTRLLDFSKSPYVAAFFATAEAPPDKCAAIWAIDALAIKRHAGALLSKGSMSVILKGQGERCLKDNDFSFSDLSVFRDLFTGEKRMAVPARVVIPVEPFRTNERSLSQQGLFLCPVSLFVTFEHALKNVVRHAKEDSATKEDVLYKISISPGAHPNTVRELHRMNINYATLFPGLDGLAQSLATVCKIRATSGPAERPPDYEFGIKF